jgi:arginyl-tRNA synthetase
MDPPSGLTYITLIGSAKGAIDTIMTNPKIPQSIKDTLKQYQDKLQNQDNTNKTPTTQDKINQQNKTPEQDKKEKENLINTIRQQLLQKAQSSSKSLNQMWTNVQKNVPSLKGKSFDQVVSMFKNGEITKEDFTSIPTRT